MDKYICIDIGGTCIKHGIIDSEGRFLSHSQIPTNASEGGPEIVRRVKGIIDAYINNETCAGVAISTAGMVDSKRGVITFSGASIPNYAGTDWKKIIYDAYHLPCSVENDVNCAGLAECISGAGNNYNLCLCLTIGTGIGGCFLMNKQIYHGATQNAMEIGYIKMQDSTFQEIASTSALIRRIADRKMKNTEEIDGKEIIDLARSGDSICIEEINRMIDGLSEGIANICYVLNPQAIILGGGIMAEEAYFSPRISAGIKKYLLPELSEKLDIVFAKHKNRAGMLGAFYHFQETSRMFI